MCKTYINWFPLACPQLGTWPTTQACALTGNQTRDPFGLQASAQTTEPHKPGLGFFSSVKCRCSEEWPQFSYRLVHKKSLEQCLTHKKSTQQIFGHLSLLPNSAYSVTPNTWSILLSTFCEEKLCLRSASASSSRPQPLPQPGGNRPSFPSADSGAYSFKLHCLVPSSENQPASAPCRKLMVHTSLWHGGENQGFDARYKIWLCCLLSDPENISWDHYALVPHF